MITTSGEDAEEASGYRDAAARNADDWAVVETVVRSSGTSFYWAIRLLPIEKRRAMFAVYAFCRDVDDIADEPAPVAIKRARLQAWRMEIDGVFRGTPRTPLARALVEPVSTYDLQENDFLAVIDGMEMDAAPRVRIRDDAELALYCERVACAVGRLSTAVFGADRETGRRLAAALGSALQLTNILRDLDEDARRNRLYLPADRLCAEGIDVGDDLAAVLAHPGAVRVCDRLAGLAVERFAEAKALLADCETRAMRPARVMMEVYRRTLDRLMAGRWPGSASGSTRRVTLSRPEKLWIAVRYGLI
ncbi:MAG: presqualene diphosphate synthase HpnD [Rhodospirillales bacterium]|nr:presqualene diphosphate synthase HpnD [Rhodospirillales bacterium]